MELDANETARGKPVERAELMGSSVRPSPRTGMSWGSAQSGVSPVGGDGRVTSMIGEPSPPLDGHQIPAPAASSPRQHDRTVSEGTIPQLSPRGHDRTVSEGSIPQVSPPYHDRTLSEGTIHELGG
jgi:hypothetical protein